jgi:hypothetical protein
LEHGQPRAFQLAGRVELVSGRADRLGELLLSLLDVDEPDLHLERAGAPGRQRATEDAQPARRIPARRLAQRASSFTHELGLIGGELHAGAEQPCG